MITVKTALITFFQIFTFVVIFFTTTFVARADVPAGGYTFGIGPTQSATELTKRWSPFIQYLSEKSGVPLQFKTSSDLAIFKQQFLNSVFDFGLLNPYHYLISRKASGYTAFAHEKNEKLYALLVVRKDSPITDVKQLKGKTLAFPSPTAFIGTWVQMAMLKENNIDVYRQYVNSMDSSYLSVAKGLFPAGGGESRTWGALDPKVKKQLRVLWNSEAYPPFAFMVHPRVPQGDVLKVLHAMETMDTDPQGIELLKAVNMKGIEKATDEDYNKMRKKNFKPFEDK